MKVVLVGCSISCTVYEVMIPFCPSGAGGCQVRESVLGLSTSPEIFKGGDEGTMRIQTKL